MCNGQCWACCDQLHERRQYSACKRRRVNPASAVHFSFLQIDISVLETIATWTSYWGFADPTDNLRNSRVWVLSAQQDSVVATEVSPKLRCWSLPYKLRAVFAQVVKKLQEFYTLFNNDPSENIKGVYNQSGEHSQLTLDYGNDCTELAEPYLNKCGYDAAGKLLQHIFKNSLVTPPSTAFNGSVFSFNQAVFFDGEVWAAAFGMSKQGYIYIPKACAAGAQCKLHVAFHGCEMTPDDIGTQYVMHGGYNSWADANNMVVLYPQAKTNALNPKGCWDWWSYSGLAYASNIGAQTLTVRRMIDALTGSPRTPNTTACAPHQEEHMHAVLNKAATLPVRRVPAVRSAGVFDDDDLNAALGNPVKDNSGVCWPSTGFQIFAKAAAASAQASSGAQNLRGQ